MVKPRAQEAREGEAAAKPKKSTGKKAGKREAVEEAEEGDQDAKGASMGKVLECAVEKAGGEAWAEEGEEEGMEAQDECVEDEAEDCEEPLWIDDLSDCRSVCDVLLQVDAVALDVEGIDLGRSGEICVIQVSTRTGAVYLFDVTTMGKGAFSNGLKELLESTSVTKLLYDCRSDADALHHLHEIRLRNVLDMQVLFAHRSGQRAGQLPGMAKALGQILSYEEHQEAKGIKAAGANMFAPEKGGNMKIWKLRPLPPLLVRYCSQDVRHLFDMWEAWDSLSRQELQEISEDRLRRRIEGPFPPGSPWLVDFDLPPPAKRRRETDA